MAHMSKGTSDNNLLLCKQYSFSDTIDREDRLVDRHLHVANSNSPVINVLLEFGDGSTSMYKNIHKCDSNGSFYYHQSSEYLIAEKSRLEEDPVLYKRVKLPEDDEVISDSLCLHKSLNSSIRVESNGKCCSLNLEDASSKEGHFPIIESLKTQRILISRRGAGCRPSDRMACELSQPELLHKGTMQSRFTDLATGGSFKDNEISEAINDSPSFLEDCMSPNAGDLFKCEMSNLEMQNHAQKILGSSSSDYMLHKHNATAEFSSCKLGFCNISGPSISRFATQMNNNDNTNSDIGARNTCSQGRSMRIKRVSSSGGLNGHVRVHQSVNKIHNCSVHNVEALRMDVISKYMENIDRESEKISSSFHYSLPTKKVHTELSHGEQKYAISEKSIKGKSSASYKMFTVPNTSESHSKKHGLSQVLTSSSCSRDGSESGRSIAHMMGTSKSSPVRIASMSIHARKKQISLGGTISNEPHKVLQGLRNSRLRKSHTALASMVKQGANREAETDKFDTDLCCLTSSDVRDPSTSKKQKLNRLPFCVQKPNGYNADSAAKSSITTDAGRRWLKRLKHEHSDSCCCSVKKSRNGDGPLTREVYNASAPDTLKSLIKQKIIDESNLRSNTICGADVSPKEFKFWVERWCCKGSQVASAQEKLAKAASSKPGNSKLLPCYSEGRKFPSVGAMALMGKVMNNLQTCKYQRKRSSIVWNV